jgi:hypothetical protein
MKNKPMAATISNARIPFGAVDPKPLKDFPEGKARLRIRAEDFVKVRIKTKTGIREFYPHEVDGFWVPLFETGRNE